MTNQALNIIDVQNDFCTGGALAVAGGDGIVAPIDDPQDRFAARTLTQDRHPGGHQSLADNHHGAAIEKMHASVVRRVSMATL